MESLSNCVGELQQQACAKRLDLENTHHGYIESRREQFCQQEELSMKEKRFEILRYEIIHEMGEVKRTQELRVDEFSVQN